jgi:3-demethoxyubiquinol 3-hydroxylase
MNSIELGRPLTFEELYWLDRALRVDHSGELGAHRIYQGQYAILKNTPAGQVIKQMWEQERYHLKVFEDLLSSRTYRVRPSLLQPFWNVAGYGLGVFSALLGKEAAMACTEAVETVIGEHYNDQLRQLMELDRQNEFENLRKVRDEFP